MKHLFNCYAYKIQGFKIVTIVISIYKTMAYRGGGWDVPIKIINTTCISADLGSGKF